MQLNFQTFKKYFRNKYIFVSTVFVIYNLFLDDVDIFTIWNQNAKISKLNTDKEVMTLKLKETKATLKSLRSGYALEKYAREEKLFKRDNEDIFIITNE